MIRLIAMNASVGLWLSACASMSSFQPDQQINQPNSATTQPNNTQPATPQARPESQPTSKPQQNDTDNKALPWFGPHNIAEWATFAITFLAILVAWRTLGILRDQTIAVRVAADAAKKSADTAEHALHTTERAYVCVDATSWRIVTPPDGVRYLNYALVNRGRTPAHSVSTFIDWRLNKDFPTDASYDRPPTFPDAYTINQSESCPCACEFPTLSQPQLTAFDGGRATLFFWGRVSYNDQFGRTHHKYFATACERGGAHWYAPKGGRNDETDEG